MRQDKFLTAVKLWRIQKMIMIINIRYKVAYRKKNCNENNKVPFGTSSHRTFYFL